MLRPTFNIVLSTALFASLCQADPATPGAAKPAPSVLKDPSSTIWQVISALGKGDEARKPFENGLASRNKKRDPFQEPIRGKYRGVVEPAKEKAQPEIAPAPVATTTLAQAIEHLSVQGIDLASREILIGSRSLTEGDLITIQYDGHPFTAWVRSIEKEGVTFINAELTETALKPVAYGPRDLDAVEQSRPGTSRLGQQSSRTDRLIPVSTSGSEKPSAKAGYGPLQIDQPDVYRLEDFPINELFEFLARKAGLQYFFNPEVDKVHVTGELARRANPMDSMQEVAFQYGLTVYQEGNTIYLITSEKKS